MIVDVSPKQILYDPSVFHVMENVSQCLVSTEQTTILEMLKCRWKLEPMLLPSKN